MPVFVLGDISAKEYKALKEHLDGTNQQIRITDGEMDFSGGFDSLRLQAEPHTAEAIVAAFEAVGVEPSVSDAGGYKCVPCADCEDYTRESYLSEDPDGDLVCESCFNRECFTCPDSGNVCWNRDGMQAPNGELYSRESWDEVCCDCENCSETIWRDDAVYSEMREQYLCTECHEALRGEEFTGVDKEFGPYNTFGTSRSFGVELESDCGMGSPEFAFDAKEDGSIEGLEYVSHILRGDAGLREIKDFLAASRDMQANEACGFHLHINVKDLNDAQRYTIFAAYAASEDVWHDHVDEERHGNSYCFRLNDSGIDDIFYAWEFNRDFRDFCRNRDRYYWMNVSAFYRHGTFENRLHHGTFAYSEIQRWIVANLRFVKAVKDFTVRNEAGDITSASKESFIAASIEAAKDAFTWAQSYQLGQVNALPSVA